jgi:hypothetical protein
MEMGEVKTGVSLARFANDQKNAGKMPAPPV